jgi:hypothetical protein
MTFKIHYVVNGVPDEFIITGETMKDIQDEAKVQLCCRRVNLEKAEYWSEEL